MKNIAKPIHVLRLHLPANPIPAPGASPEALSVAGAAVCHAGQRTRAGALRDGLTRDLITDLAKVAGMAVTAAGSVFA